jgi:hypothetical protein
MEVHYSYVYSLQESAGRSNSTEDILAIPLCDIHVPPTFLLPEFTQVTQKTSTAYDLFSDRRTIKAMWTDFVKTV